VRHFFGAACLCGIGDTVSLLMADQAFAQEVDAAIAKIGVLAGSVIAAAIGAAILALAPEHEGETDSELASD
jgi:NhaA family Na+:H+ antiporter